MSEQKIHIAIITTLFLAISSTTLSTTSVFANTRTDPNSSEAISITNPSRAVAVAEEPDYATLTWNDPWDMSESLDVRQLDSPRCVYPNHFQEVSPCPDGIWCGRVRSDVSNPDLFLLHPGYRGALNAGRFGGNRPINTDAYQLLIFRMYIDSVDPGDPGLQVIWTNGTVADIGGNPAQFGGTVLYQTYPGWNIYTIDLSVYKNAPAPPPHQGQLPWSGLITGLRLDPGLVGMNNKNVQLDWVRLSPRQTRTVQWSTDQGGPVEFKLQAVDGSEDPVRMYQVSGDFSTPVNVAADSGQYDLPVSLPAGNWNIKLGVGNRSSATAGPWQVQDVPRATILRPSFTSGEDYATTVLGRSWEMDNGKAIVSFANTTQPSFANGILSSASLDTNSQNTCVGYWEDPHLNLVSESVSSPKAIDTGKYRWLTFRLKADGAPDVSYGWVARVLWGDQGYSNAGITNDQPIHAGWNQVTLDLWRNDIVDDQDPAKSLWKASGRRGQFRIDALETPEQTNYSIDFVKLTAMESVSRGSPFPIVYQLTNDQGVTATFYYDNDTNPSNGRTRAAQASGNDQPTTLPARAFLPMMQRSGSAPTPIPSGNTFQWNTSGVQPGTYYISIELSDGSNTTTWYSEAPVIVN